MHSDTCYAVRQSHNSGRRSVRLVIRGGGAVTTESCLSAPHQTGGLSEPVIVDPDADQVCTKAQAFGAAAFKTADYTAYLTATANPPERHAAAVAWVVPNERLPEGPPSC